MSKTLSALRKLFAAVLAALSTLALVSIPAQAAVIYQDDFSGLSTDALNGQAPDIRPGSETWVAGSEWKADGTVTATNNDNSAFLAFTPTAGNIYTLSATFTQPSWGNSNGWAGIGFTDTNTTTSSFWANDAAPWFLWRPSDASSADQVVSFLGTGTSGSASEGTQTGTATLSIVLNARSRLDRRVVHQWRLGSHRDLRHQSDPQLRGLWAGEWADDRLQRLQPNRRSRAILRSPRRAGRTGPPAPPPGLRYPIRTEDLFQCPGRHQRPGHFLEVGRPEPPTIDVTGD